MGKNLTGTSPTRVNSEMDAYEMDGKYLTFFTENQLYGVSITYVVQIVGMQKITEIPECVDYAKGIINLRGTIIPVIDMRLRLGKMEKEYDERTCIIVTQIRESMMGFIVDAVDAVTDIDENNITPPPKLSENDNSYITGVANLQNKVVLLMNTTKILSENVLSNMLGKI